LAGGNTYKHHNTKSRTDFELYGWHWGQQCPPYLDYSAENTKSQWIHSENM